MSLTLHSGQPPDRPQAEAAGDAGASGLPGRSVSGSGSGRPPGSVPQVASRSTTHERGTFAHLIRALLRAPLATQCSLAVLTAAALVALLAPVIAPFDAADAVASPFAAPGSPTAAGGGWLPLGADWQGRDVLSQLIYGSQLTLGLAVLVTVLAGAMGVGLGVVTALGRGWSGMMLARLVEVIGALPPLVFALLAVSVFDRALVPMIAALTLAEAVPMFGLIRGHAAATLASEHVEAARLRGERLPWILRHEVLPSVARPALAALGWRFCSVLMSIGALGFVLRGLSPPFADWGGMARENAGMVVFGGIAPLVPAVALTLVGLAAGVAMQGFLAPGRPRRGGRRDQ